MDFEEKLRELVGSCDALAGAVFTRDGALVASVVPEGASGETFAVMCATMVGAALTAFTEIGRPPPSRLFTVSSDAQMAVIEVDAKHFVAVIVPAERALGEVEGLALSVFGLIPA